MDDDSVMAELQSEVDLHLDRFKGNSESISEMQAEIDKLTKQIDDSAKSIGESLKHIFGKWGFKHKVSSFEPICIEVDGEKQYWFLGADFSEDDVRLTVHSEFGFKGGFEDAPIELLQVIPIHFVKLVRATLSKCYDLEPPMEKYADYLNEVRKLVLETLPEEIRSST